MTYDEAYEAELNKYDSLKAEYLELLENPIVSVTMVTLPYDVLKARYLMEIMTAVKNDDNFDIPFKSDIEAVHLLKDVVAMKREIPVILDKVTYLSQYFELEHLMNKVVAESPFLPDSLMTDIDTRTEELANECIKTLPSYKDLVTKEFKASVVRNALKHLEQPQLLNLINAGVITGDDLKRFKHINEDKFSSNLNYVASFLGMDIVKKTLELKIKGTTFENKDGSSRQGYLKELSEAVQNEKVELIIKPGIYHPEVGDDKDMIEIFWGDKQLGVLGQDVVDDINQNYPDAKFSAVVKKVTGGNSVSYGCIIDFSICEAKEMDFSKEPILEKQDM